MTDVSALGPIDSATITQDSEVEKSAPWIIRKLVGSMTGRIVRSSYESLIAAGTTVVCLSPWGDSSPLLLPCIRFRDLAVHTVIVVTGGAAAVAAPVMGPVSDVVVTSLGDTILVEVALNMGFSGGVKVANDLVIGKSIGAVIPIHSDRLETTGIKVLLVTLKYKGSGLQEAALGYYRSSVHEDTSLFASVKDYLSVEKGWFSPYLFASGRRPGVPRSMKPDIIFCHGPFLEGDYRVGATLLAESALVIALCPLPQVEDPPPEEPKHHFSTKDVKELKLPSLTNIFARSRTPSPEPKLAPIPAPPAPRRMIMAVVGLKPHRKIWTSSARPGESVLNYILMNGCPAVVFPVKPGAPLVAWDALTLAQLWQVELPDDTKTRSTSGKFEGIVQVLHEFLDLCIDWPRVTIEGNSEGESSKDGDTKEALRNAVLLLVAAAIRSGKSKEVRKEVEKDRSGIAFWRIV